MLAGFKFAIQGGRKPVYRRARFDYGEGLLSGPAWAGVLAVLSARRNALRTWLGQGAIRSVLVGGLAAGLGVQAGTSPSVARSAADGRTGPVSSSAARQAIGASGLAVGMSKPSESDSDHRADAGNARATTESAKPAVGGGQGSRLRARRLGAIEALGEWIDGLGDIGLLDLSGGGGSSSGAGRPANDSSGAETAGPDPASNSHALGAFEPGSPGWQSYDAPPAAERAFGWQAASPVAGWSGRADRSVDVAGRVRPVVATTLRRTYENLHGKDESGSGGLAPASLGTRLPGSLDALDGPVDAPGGPGGVPEPATWTTMLVGLSLVGGSARRRRALA